MTEERLTEYVITAYATYPWSSVTVRVSHDGKCKLSKWWLQPNHEKLLPQKLPS